MTRSKSEMVDAKTIILWVLVVVVVLLIAALLLGWFWWGPNQKSAGATEQITACKAAVPKIGPTLGTLTGASKKITVAWTASAETGVAGYKIVVIPAAEAVTVMPPVSGTYATTWKVVDVASKDTVTQDIAVDAGTYSVWIASVGTCGALGPFVKSASTVTATA